MNKWVFAALLVCTILAVMALFDPPNFHSRPRHPIKSCWAQQRIFLGAFEQYLNWVATSPLPLDPVTGEIDQALLLHHDCLKQPVLGYPECLYRGYMITSMTPEIFCLSCGFMDQKNSTIKDEFLDRVKLSTAVSSRLSIDFSLRKDYSRQSEEEFRQRVTPPGRRLWRRIREWLPIW